MEYKAVIFDMFETLITEWGHEKYTKGRMCADLGVAPELFNPYWEEKEQDRYIGKINFADSVLYACEKCGKEMNAETLALICDKREKTKSACFEYVDPDVYELLRELKAKDLKLALRKLIHYGCFNRLLPTLNPVLAEMLVRHPGNEKLMYKLAWALSGAIQEAPENYEEAVLLYLKILEISTDTEMRTRVARDLLYRYYTKREPDKALFYARSLPPFEFCREYNLGRSNVLKKILSPEEKKPYTSKSAEEKIELLKKVLS